MKRSEWAAQLGYSQEQWGAARDELREAILEAARDRTMTNYTDVSAKVTAIPVTPRSPALFHLLGEVLEEEYKTTGLALTALVVHRAGDMEPGSGFYRMARKAGATFSDPHEFWVRQVKAIFEQYRKR